MTAAVINVGLGTTMVVPGPTGGRLDGSGGYMAGEQAGAMRTLARNSVARTRCIAAGRARAERLVAKHCTPDGKRAPSRTFAVS